MITCPLCAGTSFPTVLKLLKHIRLTHSDNENFCIQCGLQGCKRTFTNFHSFKNHVHAFHDVSAVDESQQEVHEDPTTSYSGDGTGDGDGDLGDERLSLGASESSSQSLEESLQKSAALWILKTREVHRIPLSVMDAIIAGLHSLHSLVLSHVHDRIEGTLQEANIPKALREDILHHVSEDSPYAKIFKGLETQSQQLRYFRSHFNLVVRFAHSSLLLTRYD